MMRPLLAAALAAAFVPAAGAAAPRGDVRVLSQPESRVESGIFRLTCGGTGGIGSNTCSIYGGGDYPWLFPLGTPPTGAELAAARQVLRIDHVQVTVSGPTTCAFRIGVSDPGGAALGFPGPRFVLARAADGSLTAESAARYHLPGVDMEFTTLSCNSQVTGADVQVYYTRVPRGR